MQNLISTLNQIVTSLKMPAVILSSIAIIIGAYHLILGGQEGKQKAKGWFIGGGVGLIIILLATEISNYIARQTGQPF